MSLEFELAKSRRKLRLLSIIESLLDIMKKCCIHEVSIEIARIMEKIYQEIDTDITV
jgi:hypothetical protein